MTELARTEGVLCALETAHAVAYAIDEAARMNPDQHLVINCSGRGDKDVDEAARLLGLKP
jgi:tryptophan synthase beta chain